ncbi:MAG: DUF2652 domain-containing protein [Candidatus Glassbacteria bacterium]|nr:DUF2652 domain-containing protein [Candidatus Glassbacteria bacterium]
MIKGVVMESKAYKVILIIADISGYTRYMLSNRTALVHGQVIITELTKTIMEQIEIPLEISKLEGDAVFAYAVKGDSESAWEEVKRSTGAKLIKFLSVFSEKVEELSVSNICDCNACNNVEMLKLKVIVHSGEALFYRIGKFNELSGVDVITVHKLLKNSVNADQYVLLTEPAFAELEFPEKEQLVMGEERYEDLGSIKTFTYLLPGEENDPDKCKQNPRHASTLIKAKNAAIKMMNTWQIKFGLKKLPEFKNLPGTQ